MSELFSRDYTGGAFVLFGAQHITALALVGLACLGIVLLRSRFKTEQSRRAFRWGLLGLIYLCEGSWQVWMLATDQWTVQGMLPLWLCSVTSWTMPLLLVWRKQWYYEWAYFLGVIGALMALLTPDLTIYGFPHFRFIEFLTLHGAIIAAVVYMTAVEGFRPTWGGLGRVFVIGNLYWLLCAVVNNAIGSNYLYTRGKLPTASLLDALGPHPWYLLAMEGLAVLFCLLMYLPYALKDRRKLAEA